jgi:hypothetical protein
MADPPGQMTISGQVVEGVEAGCLLLDTGDELFLLVIPGGAVIAGGAVVPGGVGPSAVRAGARLVVRGRVEAGLVSYCQQGTPFLVSEVRPA